MGINIAIFASGSGSNAENIIRFFGEKGSAQVSLVVSNRRDAYVLERAARLGIPARVVDKPQWETGEEVLALMREYHIDFIVLAGFLLRVPDALVNTYSEKIINIHPALLPKYGGKGMYGDRVHEAVVAAGEKESGITIHYVNARYDEGNIIFQATCPVSPEDTPADVARKVHALEYEHFPRVIERLLQSDSFHS